MSDLRSALEGALAANPSDVASHAAYADLLAEQGDPRGELIQVQLALEDPSCRGERRRDLKDREFRLFADERKWLGDLAGHLYERGIDRSSMPEDRVNQWYWSRGWLDEVAFAVMSRENAQALAEAPVARLLSRLSIRFPIDQHDVFDPLKSAPFLPHLRYFRLGYESEPPETMGEVANGQAGLVSLLAAMPHLEEIHLFARGLGLRELFALPTFRRLKALVVCHEREEYPLDALAANPGLTALEKLRLFPGPSSGDNDGHIPYDEAVALFNSAFLTSLQHLHLNGSSMGDEGVEELVESGLIDNLLTLDLRYGRITDAGVQTLLDSPHLHGLQLLALDHNQIGRRGRRMLEELDGVDVSYEAQDRRGSVDYLNYGEYDDEWE